MARSRKQAAKLPALAAAILLSLAASYSPAQEQAPTEAQVRAQQEDMEQLKLLFAGAEVMEARKPREAIAGYFDRILAFYEARHRDTKDRIYCARNREEAIYYLTQHVAGKSGTGAIVVGVWCDAHFLKAFALVELGRMADAKASLTSAIAMSPANSQYLSELGHVYQVEKDWSKAMETYQAAEANAALSDPKIRNTHLARAKRGMGYVLIELDRLDEAEAKYRECLEINPDDTMAAGQLDYIRRLRANKGR